MLDSTPRPAAPHRVRTVVLVTKQVPWPATSGGRMREAAVVQELLQVADEVHVVGFGPQPDPAEVPERVRVHAHAHPDTVVGTLRTASLVVGRWYNAAMARVVRELVDDPTVHLHVGFPHMSAVCPPGRIDSLDMHNVESDLLRQRASASSTPVRAALGLEAARMRRLERRLGAVPFVTCVSEQDRARFDELGLRGVVVAPNGATLPAQIPELRPGTAGALFVGALDWAPNVEGVRWFAESVWPLVRRANHHAEVVVAGRSPSAQVRHLEGAGLRVEGDFPAVGPLYAQAGVAVCPLLTGGGSRLKIVEALAHGRPVVSTTLGAEGLEDLVGRGIVIADTAQEFAARTAELITDAQERARLGALGREAVEASWSWSATLSPLRDEVAGPRAARPHAGDAVRFQPEIRSSYIERFADGPAVETWYCKTVYLDPAVLAASGHAYVQVGNGEAVTRVLRTPPRVLEIPEPLWTLRLLHTMLLAAAAKVGAAARGRRCLVVTYAIENVEPERVARLPQRVPERFRVAALRPALVVTSVLVDRWVFGTQDARHLYRSVAGRAWNRIGPRSTLILPLPAACPCGPDEDEARDPQSVVFLGALIRRKGFDRVAAAWPLVQTENASLVVLGDGELRESAQRLVESGPRVRWHPDAPREQIHAVLRRAQVLVLPSVPERYWREQIGLPVVEALAHGVTVVAPVDSGLAPWLAERGHPVVGPEVDDRGLAEAIDEALRHPVDSRPDLPGINGRATAARAMFATRGRR